MSRTMRCKKDNVIPRSVRSITSSRNLVFAQHFILYDSEVALACQKSRYLDARIHRIVRGMTIIKKSLAAVKRWGSF